MPNRHIDPTTAMEFTTHTIHEVFIDLHREAVLHTAKDADAVIIRVQVFGPTGRPTTRSLRIPTDALREPPTPTEWD